MITALTEILAATRARYAEPHRHYHGVSHLDALLSLFGEIRPLLSDPQAVELAIFYHDALYRPERSDNEAASAGLMRDDVADLVDPGTLARAETMILATRQHRIPDGHGAAFAADCALFLDLDLSVLGADDAVFDRYETGIAAEYRPFYDANAYRAGRIAVLTAFLARDWLFLSEHFAALETPARANLSRSLTQLKTGGESAATPWLSVIGLGEDGLAGLTEAARAAIDEAEILIGGERHLALIPPGTAERRLWARPLADSIEELLTLRGRHVAVLASGDPMQYGIGATLARLVPIAEMAILPVPGAFSLAAARLGWPLAEIGTLSLHGRKLDRLALYLAPGARLLALTENAAAPAAIAEFLTARGWGPSRLIVLERLGGSAERLTGARADAFPETSFAELNTLAIEAVPGPEARWCPRRAGLPDEAFRHDGQLTKHAVRAVTLAALAPCGTETLWDIGAGSGSIAIEWLRALEQGRAYAIERDTARATIIAENAAALGVPDLQIVTGSAPAALDNLPAPDAVFIGGGVDAALLELCYARLKPGGRLVANAVTIEGETSLVEFYGRRGGELSRLAVSRVETQGEHGLWRSAAPVTHYALRKDRAAP